MSQSELVESSGVVNGRVAVIIIRDGMLLLIHRRVPGQDYYVLPGGHVELEESLEEACIREVREETGLTITIKGRLCTLNNRGRIERYFLAGDQYGELQLGGPELERHNVDDQYELEWVKAEYLDQVNLLPVQIRQVCMRCLESSSIADQSMALHELPNTDSCVDLLKENDESKPEI